MERDLTIFARLALRAEPRDGLDYRNVVPAWTGEALDERFRRLDAVLERLGEPAATVRAALPLAAHHSTPATVVFDAPARNALLAFPSDEGARVAQIRLSDP